MTLDDLELLEVEILSNFALFRIFGRQQRLTNEDRPSLSAAKM